jgi:hypothetical protein
MRLSSLVAVVIILVASALPLPARAVPGAGAIVLQFQPSVRAAGMGDGGVATHWGGDTPVWSNPGLLGYRTGLRYSNMDADVATGLADDMSFTDQTLTLGIGGVGLLYCRGPLDGSDLDMGTQQAVDEDGNITGEFSSWESAERIGVGLRMVYFAETLLGRRDHDLSRWGDLGIGYFQTEYDDVLAPDEVLQDGTGGSANGATRSYGALLRVTPLNTIGRPGLLSQIGGVSVDLSYGWALLDDSDEMIVHVDADQADPFPRRYVRGWSARVALDGGLTGLARALTPVLSFGYAKETQEPGVVWQDDHYAYERDSSDQDDEESRGFEVSLLNVFHWRRGHHTAAYGDVDGDTSGWGVGLELPRIGGFRYDEATIPQATGLPDVDRTGWSVWADIGGLLKID